MPTSTSVSRGSRRRQSGPVGQVTGDIGPQLETAPRADVAETDQQARVGHPAQALVALIAGPQQLLLLAPDRPLKVHAPCRGIRVERDGSERDVDLDGPADLALVHPGIPDAVPLPIAAASRPHQRVGHQAGGVHLEEIPRLLVQECVHGPHEAVVGAQELVALAGVALQLVGLGIEADHTHVEVILVERESDFGALGGLGAEDGVLLHELARARRARPHGFVERAVENDGFSGRHPFRTDHALARIEGVRLLRPDGRD